MKGSNVVDKGFPKYVAPGEPEPGTGKPLKAGRVYINTLTPDPLPKGEGSRFRISNPLPQGEGVRLGGRVRAAAPANTSRASRPKSGISTSAAIRFARNGSKTGVAGP